MTALFVLLAATSSTWKSYYFPNIVLHRGQAPVTVQVSWFLKHGVEGSDPMPVKLSVFTGVSGKKKLASSKNIGECIYSPNAHIVADKISGESFVQVTLTNEGNYVSRLLGFKGLDPFHLSEGDFSSENGPLLQYSQAKDQGISMPPGQYGNPSVSRAVSYDAKEHKLSFGNWKVAPPHQATFEISKRLGGKQVRVRFEKQYFQLRDRKVTFNAKDNRLYVDNSIAYGHDYDTDMFKRTPADEVIREELKSFQVWINGKESIVPKHLWSTCFEPHLGQIYVNVFSGKRGAIVVSCSGSDGAGAWRAEWTRSKSGTWSRRIGHELPNQD